MGIRKWLAAQASAYDQKAAEEMPHDLTNRLAIAHELNQRFHCLWSWLWAFELEHVFKKGDGRYKHY